MATHRHCAAFWRAARNRSCGRNYRTVPPSVGTEGAPWTLWAARSIGSRSEVRNRDMQRRQVNGLDRRQFLGRREQRILQDRRAGAADRLAELVLFELDCVADVRVG